MNGLQHMPELVVVLTGGERLTFMAGARMAPTLATATTTTVDPDHPWQPGELA